MASTAIRRDYIRTRRRAWCRSSAEPGDWVLDPFCGGGTVLVEARLSGRRAWGRDLNPLAVDVCRVKLRGYEDAELDELQFACGAAADHAEARRQRRAGPTRRYGAQDRDLFEVHVLLELDGLKEGIEKHGGAYRHELMLILSSLLTKVSPARR